MSQLFAPPIESSASGRAKVFISYSRKDLAFAQSLVADLTARGFDAFLDKTDIAPGEPWQERLANLIATADTVIFVVSPDATASKICGWELEESDRRGKRVIPLVARSILDADAPAALARLNYIFCTQADDRDVALASLDQALHTDLSWVREHTRLGDLARRWDERGRPKSAALRGVELEAAERWLDRRPADANAPTDLHQDFIRDSRHTATGRQRKWVVGALIVALLAVGLAAFAEISRRDAQEQRAVAEVAKMEAQKQRDRAEAALTESERQKAVAQHNFAAAKQTVDGLIFNIAQGLRDVAGMRVETIRKILETARGTVDGLLASAPDDTALLRSRAVMLLNFAMTYLAAGDSSDAFAAAQESLASFRKLAAQDPSDGQAQRDVSVGLDKIGEVKLQGGDQAGALAAYEESLTIRRKLAEQDPGSVEAQRDVSVSLNKIGDVNLQGGHQAGALAAYEESLTIRRKLAEQDLSSVEAQRDVSVSLNNIGNVKRQGGDLTGALAAFEESLAIRRKLAAQDPGNAQALRDVSVSLIKIGEVKRQGGDLAGALAAYQESLTITRKFATRDPSNAQALHDVSVSLEKIGEVKLQQGDQAGALAAYEESMAIRRKLAAQDLGDSQAQRDVSVSLEKIGEVKLQRGDQEGALAAYEESLAIRRKLAEQDSGNAQAQWDLVVSLVKTAGVSVDPLRLYEEALAICDSLDRAGRLAPSQNFAIGALMEKIAALQAQRRK